MTNFLVKLAGLIDWSRFEGAWVFSPCMWGAVVR